MVDSNTGVIKSNSVIISIVLKKHQYNVKHLQVR